MRQKIKRMERILHTREQERDIAQTELRRCRDEEETMEERVQFLDQERRRVLEEFTHLAGACLSVQDLWYGRQRITCTETELEEAMEELARARERVVRAERELVERHQSVRMMETYVHKLQVTSERLDLASEQATLDDVASIRHAMQEVRP